MITAWSPFWLSAAAVLVALGSLVGSVWSYRRTRRLVQQLDSYVGQYAKNLRALERLAGLALDHGATLGQVRSRVGPDFLIQRADNAAATVEIPVTPAPRRRPSPQPRPQTTSQTYGRGRQPMQPWPPPPASGGNAMDQTQVIHPRPWRRPNGGAPS